MAGINTRKRGGKAHFYRMGFIEAFAGKSVGITTIDRRSWPRWAKEAYCLGKFHGLDQGRFSRCEHKPLDVPDYRGNKLCGYCGMKMRSTRWGSA